MFAAAVKWSPLPGVTMVICGGSFWSSSLQPATTASARHASQVRARMGVLPPGQNVARSRLNGVISRRRETIRGMAAHT